MTSTQTLTQLRASWRQKFKQKYLEELQVFFLGGLIVASLPSFVSDISQFADRYPTLVAFIEAPYYIHFALTVPIMALWPLDIAWRFAGPFPRQSKCVPASAVKPEHDAPASHLTAITENE